jgi:hypothetical protein
MNTETINFEFHLLSEYWNQPPQAKIAVDDIEYFNDVVPKGSHVVKFTHTCDFEKPHQLTLTRSGKNDSQCKTLSNGKKLDQILTLEKLKIDGVDIRNIVWSQSINIAEYPEPWATEQRAAGNTPEEKAIGVTTFGHNGTWYLDFTSPFYIFIMRWMGGGPE